MDGKQQSNNNRPQDHNSTLNNWSNNASNGNPETWPGHNRGGIITNNNSNNNKANNGW